MPQYYCRSIQFLSVDSEGISQLRVSALLFPTHACIKANIHVKGADYKRTRSETTPRNDHITVDAELAIMCANDAVITPGVGCGEYQAFPPPVVTDHLGPQPIPCLFQCRAAPHDFSGATSCFGRSPLLYLSL